MKERKSQTIICFFALFLFLTMVGGNVLAGLEPNQTDLPLPESDEALKTALDSAKMRHENVREEYSQALTRLKSLIRKQIEDPSGITEEEIDQAKLEHNNKGKALMVVENEMHRLQREWDRRVNIPDDVKKFDELNKFLREQYKKGVGTREEMVEKYKQFARDYPESPKASEALLNAACLYTQWRVRESGEEPYKPDVARKLHEQIVKAQPDLLTPYVVWSRHELACLYPTDDERFQGRLQFYKWLVNIEPEQYSATIKEMKREYRFRKTTEESLLRRTSGLIKTTIESVEKNILQDAKSSSNPSENIEILNKFLTNTSFKAPKLHEIQMSSISQPVKITIESDQTEQRQPEQPNETSTTIATFIKYATAVSGIGIVILGFLIFLMKKIAIFSK
jgi:hypothetical protein